MSFHSLLLTLPMMMLLMCSQPKADATGEEALGSEVAMESREAADAPIEVQSMKMAPPMASQVAANGSSSAVFDDAQKILIKNGHMVLQVDEVEPALQKALALARQYGGRPGNEERSGGTDQQMLTITLIVPAERFDALLQSLTALGEVNSRSVTVEDMTEEFVDNAARLKSLKRLETRYLELVSAAKKVSDMVEIESKLEEVRSRIEQMEGRQRYLSKNARESRIMLTLTHNAPKSTGFFTKLTDSLKGGWDLMVGLVLGVVYLWPLVLAAVMLVAFVRWLRRRNRTVK